MGHKSTNIYLGLFLFILRDNAKFNKYDRLHVRLFAIIFISRLPYNLASWEEKYNIWKVNYHTIRTLLNVMNVIKNQPLPKSA
jgi:hypothetical protein